MQIHISPRGVKLTAALHGYVAEKLESLEHLAEGLIGAHIAIYHDQTRANKHAFVVKVHLAVPGPDLHAEDHGHDLYHAIDAVVAKLDTQLRKKHALKTKVKVAAGRKAKAKRIAAGV